MNDFLWQTYHRLINELEFKSHRFLFDQLTFDNRLTGLIGARGVGKTTMLLQKIKEELYERNDTFYFSLDNTFFNETSLLNFVDDLYQNKGIRYFFIDEIHKYKNWNQELKNIYDSFPSIHVVFSGSSSIDLVEGAYDLSRRVKLLHMSGLSFREYLNIKLGASFAPITLEKLLVEQQTLAATIAQVGTVLNYFQEYLRFGYYPIVFEDRENVYAALAQVVEKTIYEDIASFYNFKTANIYHFKRILNFLATIPPGKINSNNLANHLQVDNKTVDHFLAILQKTGLIRLVYPVAHGKQIFTKPAKVYLYNTMLLAAMNTYLATDLEIGTVRELAFLQFVEGAGLKTFFPKQGDFQIGDTLFEVGGKNKTVQQLRNSSLKKLLVKDNILVGSKGEIPLYLFGFLY